MTFCQKYFLHIYCRLSGYVSISKQWHRQDFFLNRAIRSLMITRSGKAIIRFQPGIKKKIEDEQITIFF